MLTSAKETSKRVEGSDKAAAAGASKVGHIATASTYVVNVDATQHPGRSGPLCVVAAS